MTAEDYFVRIAREVFASRLSDLGAEEVKIDLLTVRYQTLGWFVELFALGEDGPRYCPRVAVGPLPELGIMERDKQVDIMHTLPVGDPLRNYNLDWRYTNPDEMRHSFTRTLNEIFIPCALPLVLVPAQLKGLVVARSEDINKRWHEEIQSHNDSIYREKAIAAFTSKSWRIFLENIRHISEERQTDIERAKIQYAEKQLRK